MFKKLLIFSVLLLSGSLWAADGSSGCGPGWYIMKENSILSSALRATTNAILFPVTTIGMTFGTSNCTQHKLVLHEKRSLHLITHSYLEIKSDMARGSGPHLSALVTTLGCPASAVESFNHVVKNNFSKIYPAADPNAEGTLTEVYKLILTNPSLTNQCSLGVS